MGDGSVDVNNRGGIEDVLETLPGLAIVERASRDYALRLMYEKPVKLNPFRGEKIHLATNICRLLEGGMIEPRSCCISEQRESC